MQKQNQANLKQVKIMSKDTEDKGGRNWELSIGLYPGILFGSRLYEEAEYNTWVFYLPFIDVALIIEN